MRALVGLLLCWTCAANAQLTVMHGTIRMLPPSVPNTSVYFSIENSGDTDRVLIGAKGEIAKQIEIHNHVQVENMMQMRRQSEVIIPAGETIQFQPGGLHLMLFDLTTPVTSDTPVTLTLLTKKGEPVSFTAHPVKPGSAHHHH